MKIHWMAPLPSDHIGKLEGLEYGVLCGVKYPRMLAHDSVRVDCKRCRRLIEKSKETLP